MRNADFFLQSAGNTLWMFRDLRDKNPVSIENKTQANRNKSRNKLSKKSMHQGK